MFSFLTNVLLAALLTGNLGGSGDWLRHIDPVKPADRSPKVGENVRVIKGAHWDRPFQIGQPVSAMPVRTHGGIGP